ncbi:hypothetical protein HGA34_04530 [Candidatus Falkowbacteria bacterium]|nr:hypothetical protein [Candidatus Falkowbacteria bacterium]
MESNKKNKTLIIAATHGDEKIGLEVASELMRKGLSGQFDLAIGNPFALAAGRRFIERDLNRAYPGDIGSKLLEDVLACKNLDAARSYRYVIDLHEARCGSDNFIIAPREELPKEFPLEMIDLRTVLLWPEPKGPMASLLENAIELEFGMLGKDRSKVVAEAVAVCEKFFSGLARSEAVDSETKDVYEVYGHLPAGEPFEGQGSVLKDFELAKMGSEEFYPLLVNQYIEEGISCYKMRKK